MKRGIYFLIIAMVVCLAGCASNGIDSDFPELRTPAEYDYYPLIHFQHLRTFDHLDGDYPPLFSEELTQC